MVKQGAVPSLLRAGKVPTLATCGCHIYCAWFCQRPP